MLATLTAMGRTGTHALPLAAPLLAEAAQAAGQERQVLLFLCQHYEQSPPHWMFWTVS